MKPPRWSLLRKGLVVPNFDNPSEVYLTRWRVFECPWFGVYLHRMDGPDSRSTLHDHPWNATSLVLSGGYMEKRLYPKRMTTHIRPVRRLNRLRTHDAHAILKLLRKPTFTLMFVGRRVREWGYWERVPENAFHLERWLWTAHEKHPHHQEWLEAMEARTPTPTKPKPTPRRRP